MDLFSKIEKESSRSPIGPPEWLIVGLGNPGGKYEMTRHNVGFLTLDTLAVKHKIDVRSLKFKALCGLGQIANTQVMLMKPQTFMNLSGESVHEASVFYKIPSERILVLYDDIALPIGKVRIRQKGSAGGHNGIKNIISLIQSDIFPRIKIGVGTPPHPDYDIVDWVLGIFTSEEKETLAQSIDRAVDAVFVILSEGCVSAASQISKQ